MTAILTQEQSSTAPWCRRLAFFSAALLLVAGAGHRFGLVETVPFLWLLGLVCLLALLALVLGAVTLAQAWEHGVGGALEAGFGIFVALLVLTPYGISLLRVVEHPRLVDISTDLENPPAFIMAPRSRTSAMNRIDDAIGPDLAAVQKEQYPAVTGRRYEHAAENVVEVVMAMMNERGWEPRQGLQAIPAGNRTLIEGTAHTFFLGFVSDVVIRIEDDQTATFVDMRSASRYGRHDLGDNAARIKAFFEELDQRMTMLAGV
ncbi:DUF1499 domain-containing protein [Nitratireductor sp. ZSWI3]|uniref:DUF1499 domain-containing protein n=1 Tax=Nitratireductor sp. ZSWI3 TaxID=2966359 RepID=UPI0021505B0C|nr:DUF1499 domain-containing protein [Nitratireductor sp. ZSWI3]MCR4268278.1 DUF1499 domain-containing protein [Nitratireductor sp. ZSWI3]